MARADDNIVTHNVQGAIGKELVYKKVNGKTIVSRYPDMSNVTYNKKQKKQQDQFAGVVAYARSVNNDPVLKAEWKRKIAADDKLKGYSVYQAVVKERLCALSTKPSPHLVEVLLSKCLEKGDFTDRQIKGLEYITTHGELTNAIYQRINEVSKATATRDLQDLVKKQVIECGGRGGAAVYKLLISLKTAPAR